MTEFFAPPAQPVRQTNGLASSSLILAGIALIGSWIPALNIISIIMAVTALVLGAVSLGAKRRHQAGRGLGIAGIAVAVLTILISILVNYSVYTSVDDAVADFETNAVQTQEPTDESLPEPSRDTSQPAEPKVSMEEQMAVDAAEDYLEYGAFSKQGLIDQLSSDYGEQFPVTVAKSAVESLDTNWSAEAVEAAQSYLDYDSFSCSGLVDQLSSEYGEQFTVKQAKQAGIKVGLCPK